MLLFGLFVINALVVLILNLMWLWVKQELKHNDYEVHFFRDHFSDLSNLSDLIDKTQDPGIKSNYRMVLRTIRVLLAMFLVLSGVIVFLLN